MTGVLIVVESWHLDFPVLPADNDNRPKLEAISGSKDCQHSYINASFIDVSLLVQPTPEREREREGGRKRVGG